MLAFAVLCAVELFLRLRDHQSGELFLITGFARIHFDNQIHLMRNGLRPGSKPTTSIIEDLDATLELARQSEFLIPDSFTCRTVWKTNTF